MPGSYSTNFSRWSIPDVVTSSAITLWVIKSHIWFNIESVGRVSRLTNDSTDVHRSKVPKNYNFYLFHNWNHLDHMHTQIKRISRDDKSGKRFQSDERKVLAAYTTNTLASIYHPAPTNCVAVHKYGKTPHRRGPESYLFWKFFSISNLNLRSFVPEVHTYLLMLWKRCMEDNPHTGIIDSYFMPASLHTYARQVHTVDYYLQCICLDFGLITFGWF